MMPGILKSAIAIFRRDIKKFLSNPFIIMMTLLMPIMYLVVFGNAMGGTLTHIPVGVVQEVPPYNDTPLFTSAAYQLNHISQGSNNDAEKLLDVTVYTDEVQAKQDLANGKISAVVVFPASVSNDNAVRLYVDSSDSVTPSLVEEAVTSVLQGLGANNPITVDKIYGDIKYIQFFGVGVIMMAIFSATSFGGGLALIRDRENGIHEGYLVTPIKRSSIVVGIIASGTVRAFVAGFTIFWIDLLVTGIILQSFQDFLLVLLVIFIACVGVTSLVVSFASRFSAQQEYQSVIVFLNLILFMTSGAFYPVTGMPGWLRWITTINPEYYGVNALRSIILRNQGLNVIGIDLIALLIFSTAMIILGVVTYRRTLE
ncbi:ABC-2 type transporter [Methanoregula boonei 6A8]|uniref:ABC-2 type transporter n=1 Tax=Methanoregula boonei (strain DSM 21154 / JCM 14090 / 6A8) TaxID=456442 RepID=A7I5X0_METB6|nr:ABC transporter permease [Methanoregula boonei]ABS55131.1 ABC-2 type transporter [Methanoregula boonei 6A8]